MYTILEYIIIAHTVTRAVPTGGKTPLIHPTLITFEPSALPSVQNELVPALVRRQFRSSITGGGAMTKRVTSVMGEAIDEEAMVASLSRWGGSRMTNPVSLAQAGLSDLACFDLP